MSSDTLNIIFFAITVALSFLSIGISFFAIKISSAESKRAQDLWITITREVKGLSIRSENTERTTQRVFDNMMNALISANTSGNQHVAKDLSDSKQIFSKDKENSLSKEMSILETEKKKIVADIPNKTLKNTNPKLPESEGVDTNLSLSNLQNIFYSSENPAIAKRYVEFVLNNPNKISLESIKATNYEEYARILDFLIVNKVLTVSSGVLNIDPLYEKEIQDNFKIGSLI